MLRTTPVVWLVGRVVGISISGNIHLATTVVCLLLSLMFLCIALRCLLSIEHTLSWWHHPSVLPPSSTTSSNTGLLTATFLHHQLQHWAPHCHLPPPPAPALGSSLPPSSTTSWVTTEGGYKTIYLATQQPVVRAAAAAAAAAAPAHCPTYRLLG